MTTGTILRQFSAPNPNNYTNGRSIAFDGANLWFDYAPQWNPETDIYEMSTTDALIRTLNIGVGVGALAWDAKRGVLWGGAYDGTATLQFSFVPPGGNCFGDAPGFIDGLDYDPGTDTLWISDDGGHSVFNLSVTGAQISSFSMTTSGYDCNSGIAVE